MDDHRDKIAGERSTWKSHGSSKMFSIVGVVAEKTKYLIASATSSGEAKNCLSFKYLERKTL